MTLVYEADILKTPAGAYHVADLVQVALLLERAGLYRAASGKYESLNTETMRDLEALFSMRDTNVVKDALHKARIEILEARIEKDKAMVAVLAAIKWTPSMDEALWETVDDGIQKADEIMRGVPSKDTRY